MIKIIEHFNISNLTKKTYVVGRLTQKIITLLQLNRTETEILFGADKIKYTEKHKHKFISEDEYNKHIESTPEIIANPDCVALHPSGESIEFIKKIDKIMLVAVRYRSDGVLWIKTVFPISEEKFTTYNNWGTIKQVG